MNNNLQIIEDAKATLRKASQELVTELSKQAEQDILIAYDQIVKDYYGQYTPKSYKRHKRNGFKNSLISHHHNVKNGAGYTSVKLGADFMTAKYNIDSDNIFSLIWYHGVRGLPKYGVNPLSHSFDWYYPPNTYMHWQAGDRWYNPYWDIKKYKNVFLTTVEVGNDKTSKPKVPNMAMEEFVDKWFDTNGTDIWNKIMDKYF